MSQSLDALRGRLFTMHCQSIVSRRLRAGFGQWSRSVTAYTKPDVRASSSTGAKVREPTPLFSSHKGASATPLRYIDKAVETEELSGPELYEWSAHWPTDSSSSDAHSAQWQQTDSYFVGRGSSQSSGTSSWPPSISASQLTSSSPSERSSDAENESPQQQRHGHANFSKTSSSVC